MRTSFFKGVDRTVYWLGACLSLLAAGAGAQTLPSSGLQLWLKADAGVTLNGSTVSQWADQSGSGYNASQTTTSKQPSLVSSVLNGKPVVRFDGAANYLDTTLGIPANTVPFATIFTVEVMRQNPSTYVSVWSTDGSIGGWQRGRGFDQFGNFQIQQGNANSFEPNVGVAANTPRIVGVVYTPQDTVAYVNGQMYDAGTANAATGAQPLRIGAGYQGGQTAPVDIAEVIVYNRVLSAIELQQVQTYLQTKYAVYPVAAPLPASGLTLWLKADAGISFINNGSTVSQWTDQTGNGYNASQAIAANQPLWLPNALNGRPVVRFDGADDFLDTTLSIPASSMPNVTVYTLEIRRRYGNEFPFGSTTQVWSTDGSVGGWQRGHGFDQNGNFLVQQGSANSFSPNVGNAPNIPKVVGVAYTPTDTFAYVNGQTYHAGSPNTATGSQPLRLGAGYQGGQNGEVDIAEVLVYNRVLSADEQQQVQNYFQLKYNLPGAVPSFGLELWLTANGGVAANGSSQISQWTDQSGAGNNASQATTSKQPLLVANVLSGKPVARFDGVSQFLDNVLKIPAASMPNVTIYTVETMRQTPSSYVSVWSTDGSVGGWQRGRGFDQTGKFLVQQGNANAFNPSGGIAVNTPRIVGLAYTPSDTIAYLSGIYHANSGNSATGTQPLRLGAGYQGGQNAPVDIAEVLVYNRLLSDSERSLVETSLNAKYGINTVLTDTDYDGIPDWKETRDGTNPNDPASVAQVRLAYLPLNDPYFRGERGQIPRDSSAAVIVPSWDGGAVDSYLTYNDVEADGTANINCRAGTVRFWFTPSWTSAAAGGRGPANVGYLIAVGANWSLTVDSQGNNLLFASGSSGTPPTLLTAGISWTSNQWHQVCLTYSPSGSVLYLDGAQAGTGSGVASYPDLPTRNASGMSIGVGPTQGTQPYGEFNEVETFNYQLSASTVAGFYNQSTEGDGIPDYWKVAHGFNPRDPTIASGDPDGDGLTNLREYQLGTDPNNPDTDYDGRNDGQEVADGTDPLNPNSVLQVQLGLWRFDTLNWQGEQGQLPLVNTGLGSALVPGVEADAVDMTGPNGVKELSYNHTEANALANINLRAGTIRFWFQPNWSSVSQGGNGPGATGGTGKLIQFGAWNSGATIGEWRIILDSTGDKIMLDSQDGQGHTATLPWSVIPGGMVAGQWHQIAATYSPSSASIYVDGNVVYSGAGLNGIYPPQAIRNLGFYIGTDIGGSQKSSGAFDLLDTYNYQLSASQIAAPPNQSITGTPVSGKIISVANPVDVKWTAGEYLYVLSKSSATITQFSTNGAVVRTLGGIGSNPGGLDVDSSGNVYVAMTGNNQVWRFKPTVNSLQADTAFNSTGHIGRSDGTAGAVNGEFNAPTDVAVSSDGTAIYVSDTGNNRIQKFTSAGYFELSVGSSGSAIGQFTSPKGLSFAPDGTLLVADSGNNRMVRLLGDEVYAIFGSAGASAGQYQSPANVSLDLHKIYVADTRNNRVQKLDRKTFNPLLSISSQFSLNQPQSVSLATDLVVDRIYIADTGNNRIVTVGVPKADPLAVWNLARQNLISGNIETALTQFSGTTIDSYRALFNAIGNTGLNQNMTAIGQLSPLYIDDKEARYYFSTTINGQQFIFLVTFGNENGVWKIRSF